MIRISKALVLFIFISSIIFSSCAPSENQEEKIMDSHHKYEGYSVLTIYQLENTLQIWDRPQQVFNIRTDEFKLVENIDLPLGKYQIDSVSNHIVYLKNNSKINLGDNFNREFPYIPTTLLIAPTKPNEYGEFKTSFYSNKMPRAAFLKSKLEWESVFGPFKKYTSN